MKWEAGTVGCRLWIIWWLDHSWGGAVESTPVVRLCWPELCWVEGHDMIMMWRCHNLLGLGCLCLGGCKRVTVALNYVGLTVIHGDRDSVLLLLIAARV